MTYLKIPMKKEIVIYDMDGKYDRTITVTMENDEILSSCSSVKIVQK